MSTNHEIASISPIERPFSPDGSKDFGDDWRRQAADQVTPGTRRLAKPNALMFFHIPMYVYNLLPLPFSLYTIFFEIDVCKNHRQESYASPDIDSNTGLPLDIGIHDIEERGDAKHNDGFFDKGILQAYETDHNAGGNMKEVKVIANGHCHSKCSMQVMQALSDVCGIISHGKLQESEGCLVMFRRRRVSRLFNCLYFHAVEVHFYLDPIQATPKSGMCN